MITILFEEKRLVDIYTYTLSIRLSIVVLDFETLFSRSKLLIDRKIDL